MKITIDVDCTPEEARRFLGLPDVAPLQAELLEELRKRMMANLEASDPETLMKAWLPVGIQGLEAAQKMFWSQMSKAAAEAQKRTKPSGGG